MEKNKDASKKSPYSQIVAKNKTSSWKNKSEYSSYNK